MMKSIEEEEEEEVLVSAYTYIYINNTYEKTTKEKFAID